MTKYASDLPDFPDLLSIVADWKGLPAAIVEKDYYLTRALHSLCTQHNGQFILKGGTSLAKGWNLLERFSEDLDILVRAEPEWGKGARDNRLKALRDTIANTPGLRLDSTDKRARAKTGVSRTAVYLYNSASSDLAGLGKNILFEAGYRGSTDAAIRRGIQSWIAEFTATKKQADLAEDLAPFETELQDIRRTLVEKAFAIHAYYAENHCVGRTRHYYDFYKLCGTDEIKGYIGTSEYRQCVADVRRISLEAFPKQTAPDDDSFSRSPAFAPTGESFSILERHYQREKHIFFSDPPSLKLMLDEIAKLLPKL